MQKYTQLPDHLLSLLHAYKAGTYEEDRIIETILMFLNNANINGNTDGIIKTTDIFLNKTDENGR